MKQVVAIIQARMGSTRLPGKVLANLADQPLLFHIISRAQKIRTVDKVVLATTTRARDDQLIDLAQSMDITIIRGSEDNVLKRFLTAMQATQADIIIRICSDAPLFDPEFLNRSVSLLKEHDADLVMIRNNIPTAYQGASAISARALYWTWQIARDDPLAYEHVTAYAFAHSDKLQTITIDPDPDMVGDFQFYINTPEELKFIRWIYDKLYVPGEIVSLRDAVALVKGEAISQKSNL